ncbi:hypothetical protein PQY68_02565 [Planktomarina temperata]|nr:hypothetical protein [Planktomarina temperata]
MFKKVSEHLCLEKETMTIQQHASFDSSAAELNATSKLVKAWESKNAKNAARAGGVSLMALSLAACGGSSDTVDITSDNAAAIVTALTTEAGVTYATVDAAVAAGIASVDITSDNAALIAAAVAAVDTTTDDAAAVSLALRNAAADAGVTGTATMTNAELITAIKTANDASIAAGVDLTTNDTAAINAAVVALGISGVSTLAQLNTAYDLLANPTVTTLTTSVDSLTGTTGADTFTADNTGTDVTSVADTVNGGDGTDTINIYSDGAAAALPALVSVETVNFYDQDADVTLTATPQSSLETVNLIRGDGFTLTLGANVATVGLTDIIVPATDTTTDDVIVAFEAARTVATLNLNNVDGTAGDTLEDVQVTGAALTTVNVNAIGSASSFDALDLAAAATINLDAAVAYTSTIATTSTAATLNITGAGAVTLGALDAGIDVVAAGAATGAITMTAAANNADAVITLGSGNDVFTTDDDGFATADLFAVNAGDGTDILVLGAAADMDTAVEGARYTGFETLRTGDSQDMDFASGFTGLQITGASSKSYTDMTAAQAANVQVRGDETSATFALKTATATDDALSLTMGTGLTTSAATDIVTGVTVTGFETLNIIENGGATASVGADQTAIVAAFTGTTLNDINLTGRAVTLSDVSTTVAVNIDGTELTGNGATSGAQGLTVAGSAVAGSTINGSEVRDSLTAGAEGSTYNGNGGNDAFSATVALIAADGTTDLVLNGGAGTDTLTLTNTTGNTIADTHFTNISAMEGLTLTNTGAADTSITTGASFNTAFSSGATITSGNIAATYDITIAAGLSTVDTTVSIAATTQTGAATETNSIVTGSGSDTITYADTGWVGVAGGAGGTITIDTKGGDDTISVTVGTIVSDTTDVVSITAGAGQDSITKVGTNADDAQGVFTFVMAAGDSDTVTYDTITGFDLATTGTFSDALDFEGTAVVASFTATVDVGTIMSHSVSTGIVTFDDVADFSSALTISSTNLADVVSYLATNMTANHVAAFAYDSTDDGSADGTMVFHQSSATNVSDDLVFLAGVTADSVLTTNASASADDLFVM